MNTWMRWTIALVAGLLVGLGLSSSTIDRCGDSAEGKITAARAAGTIHDGYTVQEIRYGAAVIREYVAPSGVVFGIDWRGMVHPDAQRLLGSFTNACPEDSSWIPGQGRRKVRVEAKDDVIRKWGPPTDLHGRAYAPRLTPPGINVDKMWLGRSEVCGPVSAGAPPPSA